MYTFLVVTAAVSYTVGGLFMKLADGFVRPGPSFLVFAFFAFGAALQTLAMRGSQLSVTYVVVLGLEAALAVGFGTALFREAYPPLKILGTALVLVGVVLLRRGDG